jgi:hypothetical protein
MSGRDPQPTATDAHEPRRGCEGEVRNCERVSDGQEPRHPVRYEPPRVEQALTPEDLEQEVLYAGEPTADETTDG